MIKIAFYSINVIARPEGPWQFRKNLMLFALDCFGAYAPLNELKCEFRAHRLILRLRLLWNLHSGRTEKGSFLHTVRPERRALSPQLVEGSKGPKSKAEWKKEAKINSDLSSVLTSLPPKWWGTRNDDTKDLSSGILHD